MDKDKGMYCQSCGKKTAIKKLYKSSKCPHCGSSFLYWQPVPIANPSPPPEDESSDQEEPNEPKGS